MLQSVIIFLYYTTSQQEQTAPLDLRPEGFGSQARRLDGGGEDCQQLDSYRSDSKALNFFFREPCSLVVI